MQAAKASEDGNTTATSSPSGGGGNIRVWEDVLEDKSSSVDSATSSVSNGADSSPQPQQSTGRRRMRRAS